MKTAIFLSVLLITMSCNTKQKQPVDLYKQIESNSYFAFTKEKSLELVKTGFNAGEGYGEVWIRDYNTFIELSAEVFEPEVLKENLLVFFKMLLRLSDHGTALCQYPLMQLLVNW